MINCSYCGVLTKNKKYCSQTCSNTANGFQKLKLSPTSQVCLECNELLSANKFSLICKWDISQGRKDTCKKCSAKLREKARRDRTWKHKPALAMLQNSKYRARNAGIEHTLTLEDIEIPDYCPVLGIKLSTQSRDKKYSAPSIDRIDNSKGYTKDNIIITSVRANLLKKDATILELQLIAKFYERYL